MSPGGLRDGRVRGGAGGAPRTHPHPPPEPTRRGAAPACSRARVGAPRDDGDGDGGRPSPGPGARRRRPAGLFGAPQGGMGPGGGAVGPVGITMHQHRARHRAGASSTSDPVRRPGPGPPAPAARPAASTRGSPGGADVGPPAFFAGGDVRRRHARARARPRADRAPEPGRAAAARRRRRRRRTAAAAHFARRPETRVAGGGGAPGGLGALPHAGNVSLPSPNGSSVGGGEPWAAGRAAGVFGAAGAARGENAKSNGGGGEGDQPSPVPRRCPSLGSHPQVTRVLVSFLCFLFSARRSRQRAFLAETVRRGVGRRAPGRAPSESLSEKYNFTISTLLVRARGAQNISN